MVSLAESNALFCSSWSRRFGLQKVKHDKRRKPFCILRPTRNIIKHKPSCPLAGLVVLVHTNIYTHMHTPPTHTHTQLYLRFTHKHDMHTCSYTHTHMHVRLTNTHTHTFCRRCTGTRIGRGGFKQLQLVRRYFSESCRRPVPHPPGHCCVGYVKRIAMQASTQALSLSCQVHGKTLRKHAGTVPVVSGM